MPCAFYNKFIYYCVLFVVNIKFMVQNINFIYVTGDWEDVLSILHPDMIVCDVCVNNSPKYDTDR